MERSEHIPHLKNGRFPSLLTPEREAQLRHLVADNPEATLKELAESMGNVVGSQSIKGWCKKLGLPYRKIPPTQGKLTREVERRLRAFVAEHPKTNLAEIAEAIGHAANKGTLCIWINKLGLKYSQKKVFSSTALTPEIETKLKALFRDHPSPCHSEIVAAIGRRVQHSTIKQWCGSLGLAYRPRPGNKSELSPEIEAKLRVLVAENPSLRYHELAAALGVNTATAAGWARRLNLPHQDPWQILTPDMQSRLQTLIANQPSASFSELSKIMGVHENTFRRWVKQLERSQQHRKNELAPELRQRLLALLAENPGATLYELAKTMNLPASRVKEWMRGNVTRSRHRAPKEIHERLRNSLTENPSAKYTELADTLKISCASVRYMAKKLGLPKRQHSNADVLKMKARLQALIVENPMATYKQLAKILGIHGGTASRWARQSGEPKRCVHKYVTPIMQERLRALVADRPSASYKELADAMEISMASVSHWVRKLNLPHRVGRELRS